MIVGTAIPQRKKHIIGTKGEIFGTLEDGKFIVSLIDPSTNCEHEDTVIDTKVGNDSCRGGELMLAVDFVRYNDNINKVLVENLIFAYM